MVYFNLQEIGNEFTAFSKYNWTFQLFTRLSVPVQNVFISVSTKLKVHKQSSSLHKVLGKAQQQLEINCKRLTM